MEPIKWYLTGTQNWLIYLRVISMAMVKCEWLFAWTRKLKILMKTWWVNIVKESCYFVFTNLSFTFFPLMFQHVLKFAEMSQEIQVPRLVTPRQELLVTPSRRKFNPCIKKNSLEEANMETEIKEYDFDAGLLTPIPVVTSTFPSLFLMGPDDEKTLTNLKVYLQQRLVTRNEALEKFNGCKFPFEL